MNKLIQSALLVAATSAFFTDPDLVQRTANFSVCLGQTFPVTHNSLTNCLLAPTKVDVCPLRCTNEAIAVYWACAADCVERLAPNFCITEICQAKVVAFDVPCLKACPPADQFL